MVSKQCQANRDTTSPFASEAVESISVSFFQCQKSIDEQTANVSVYCQKKSSHNCLISNFLTEFCLDIFQPLSVYNDTRMPIPLVVQLCDKLGNPSLEANVKVVLNCDRGIKVRALD